MFSSLARIIAAGLITTGLIALAPGKILSESEGQAIHFNFQDTNNLRREIKEYADKKFGCFIFGNFLDELEKNAAIDYYSGKKEFDFVVPKNFLVKEMDLEIEIYMAQIPFMKVYQDFESEKILVLETKVALGRGSKNDGNKRFSTPSGNFFLQRVIHEPWWYPPGWAHEKHPSKPGKDNPYGVWMSELSRTEKQGNYNFYVEGDSKVRIHATNKPDSIGTYASHGCIRLHPDVAEEFFPALLHYYHHENSQTNKRGTVYPLYKSIPLTIK